MASKGEIEDTYIVKCEYEIYRIVINYSRGIFTLYSPRGEVMVRLEHLTTYDMQMLKKKIIKYMDDNLNKPRPFFGGYLV